MAKDYTMSTGVLLIQLKLLPQLLGLIKKLQKAHLQVQQNMKKYFMRYIDFC